MPTIEQLKAARDDLNRVLHSKSSEITWEDVVDILAPHWRTFSILLDQAIERSENATAINAPDLESLKREVCRAYLGDSASVPNIHAIDYTVDYLAPRIVREGMVVVQDWQPIETAPLNHEMVLVCLPRMMNLVVRSWYDTIHKCWKSDRDTDGGITKVEFYHKGDLWMPLPQPPASKGE